MGMWEEWEARRIPPRSGNVRAVSVSNASANSELDNDLYQDVNPGDVGPCLLTVQAEGNDCYILFGPTNAVAANSAATSGATRCLYVPVTNGGNRDGGLRLEVNPAVDKYIAYVTKNGTTNTATLRYYLSGPTKQARITSTGT